MMLTRRIAVLTIATLSVAMLDACKKKPEPAPIPAAAPPRGPNADSAAEAERARIAAENARRAAERRRQDSIDAANRERDAMTRDAATLRATLTATVHFEFDQSDLRPDDKSLLDAKIPILQANTSVMIRVSGHTDERGSDEYNLALGQRRAAAAAAAACARAALSASGPRVGAACGIGAGSGFFLQASSMATDSVAIVSTAIRRVSVMSGLREVTGRDCM